LALDGGQKKKALKNLKATETNFREIGMDWSLAATYAAYADLWKWEGDIAKARETYQVAIDIFQQCGADGWVKKYEEEMARL
jgi:hypothetical protein